MPPSGVITAFTRGRVGKGVWGEAGLLEALMGQQAPQRGRANSLTKPFNGTDEGHVLFLGSHLVTHL